MDCVYITVAEGSPVIDIIQTQNRGWFLPQQVSMDAERTIKRRVVGWRNITVREFWSVYILYDEMT